MNVYTAEIEIQLSTLLSNVFLRDCLPKRSWTGSTKWMRAKSLLPQRRPCSVLLQASRHNNNTEIQLHCLIYSSYIYSTKLNSLAISFQDFISKLLTKYNLENLSLNYMSNWEVLLPPQSQYTV